MAVIFAERNPTFAEIEKFRLILSTFQDGLGMQAIKKPKAWTKKQNAFTLPGWRDFERAVALAFDGQAMESKWIYDVVLSDPQRPTVQYGLSCKMRSELRRVHKRDGRVTIEMSNASGEFWDLIEERTGLNQDTYAGDPAAVGVVIINLVEDWHRRVSIDSKGKIDSARSFFLTLQWNTVSGEYQLFQFPINLPNPHEISWEVKGRRLVGADETGVIFEWYGRSGGQLKYYPFAKEAVWQSDIFQLEPLPNDLTHIIVEKAASYFPEKWQTVGG